MASMMIERLQFVTGLDPAADSFAGGTTSDVIDMAPFNRLVFAIHRGDATGGTAAPTYTVLACDDTTPSNTTAIAFNYRTDGGAITAATTTGFQGTAGDSVIDLIEIDEQALAATGYGYVQLAIAETVNDPQVNGVLVVGELKDARAAYSTVTD